MFKLKVYLLTIIFILSALFGALGLPYQFHDSKHSLTSDFKHRVGVYGGQNATIEDHPYLVSLLSEGTFICTGVIISDRWALFMPTCFAYQTPSELTLVAESQDGLTGVAYEVNNWHSHPKSGSEGLYMDYQVGVLQIKGSFAWSNKTQAANLPSKDAKPNTEMSVAGWGALAYGGEYSTLHEGTMTWLSKKKCKKTFVPKNLSNFTSRMGCLYNKGKTSLCDGDWGVPAVKDGVVYGQFTLAITAGFCTSYASPVLMSDITPVTSWIKAWTGAKYDYE